MDVNLENGTVNVRVEINKWLALVNVGSSVVTPLTAMHAAGDQTSERS